MKISIWKIDIGYEILYLNLKLDILTLIIIIEIWNFISQL
jgi:hypothetical protein